LNVAALFLTPRALERLGGSSFDEQWPAWIAVGPILLDNLVLGQSGPLLLYLATVGLAWAREGRLSGLPLGIAALLKVLPIAFLALPLSLGRARGALIGLAACLGVAGAGCALALGTGPVIAEARGWVTEVSVRQTPSGLLAAGRSLRFNNQGLAVTLARTLGDIDPARAKGAVRLASLPLAVPLRIAQGIVAAMILVGAVALWRARRDPTPTTWLGLYGMIATGMLASAPLVWTHYFLWQFPALAFLARRRRGLVWTVGVVSAACLAWQPARALGAHMALSILLYAIVARDVLAGE
jgi:alpha-1,2-mannosyltransferase